MAGDPTVKKRKKPAKSYDNQFLSGPEYNPDRPGKLQKTQQAKPVSKRQLKPRKYTVSLAIPASILDTAPTLEMKTLLAGQIGRLLAIHKVDEIIIYSDKPQSPGSKINPNLFLARVFQYMETPPYLRKALVPVSSDLKFAGLLPHLEASHHPSRDEGLYYREGVTLDKEGACTLVDVGLYRRARLEKQIQPGVRVTVELPQPIAAADTHKGQKPINAKAVSPKVPREKSGLYWGYSIRLASSISRVMTESPYEGGYDFTVGVAPGGNDMHGSKVKSFSHILLVFGGLQEAVEADEDLKVTGDDAAELFDLFIDPGQRTGVRSVRVEESVSMVMSVFGPSIEAHGR
ncbi:ci114 protein [Lichtheimia corymbifera JMRC:FSU:9682]|uniref:Ci114 protein n=1 Tax=Lichtheimia corymbifera JMRC:FSU:9682 TaxID=1263082 RepID=A0A068SFZ3_9FUNG|nr:ci114 protein [Lichtheimia corymbifera JMRC:FSU:9682]